MSGSGSGSVGGTWRAKRYLERRDHRDHRVEVFRTHTDATGREFASVSVVGAVPELGGRGIVTFDATREDAEALRDALTRAIEEWGRWPH